VQAPGNWPWNTELASTRGAWVGRTAFGSRSLYGRASGAKRQRTGDPPQTATCTAASAETSFALPHVSDCFRSASRLRAATSTARAATSLLLSGLVAPKEKCRSDAASSATRPVLRGMQEPALSVSFGSRASAFGRKQAPAKIGASGLRWSEAEMPATPSETRLPGRLQRS
jgi:hypothetical protein